MRIEKIQPAFWIILTLLSIVLMVGLQTLFDRFYPFDGSRMWVSGLSFGVVLWSLWPTSMRFGWFGMTKLDAAKVVKTEIKSPLEFMVLWFVIMISFFIFISFLFNRIPILNTHWKNNPPFILGSMMSMQIARYIAFKRGWMIERPIEPKLTEK